MSFRGEKGPPGSPSFREYTVDEEYSEPPDFEQPKDDYDVYTFGRIQHHNIVIASLPSGIYGPAYDHRLNNMSTCGPFASVRAFNDFLVAPVKDYPRPELVAKYRSRLRDDHGITFAHADISWENILVDPPTGNITGVLD